MLKITLVGLFTVVYLLMLLGIGRLIEQVVRTRFPVAFTLCLGMAGLIFMGGVVNLAGVAYPLVLDGLA